MWRWILSAASLSVVFACSDSGGTPSSSEALVLNGGQCPVTTCSGAGCERFTPKNGEYLVANALKSMSAPDTGSPLPPLVQRQIRTGEEGKYLRPSIPPMRTTGDGRVAVSLGRTFFSMKLEMLRDQPIMKSANELGDELEGSPVRMRFADGTLVADGDLAPQRRWNRTPIVRSDAGAEVALCEYEHDQPHTCARGVGEDCYDAKVIQHVQVTTPDGKLHVGLESIPVHIRVRDAKTPQAEVESVTADDPSTWERSQLASFAAFEEGLHTRDGHLLLGRATDGNNTTTPAFQVVAKYKLSDGKAHDAPFSLAYAYAEHACDVNEWMDQENGVLTSMRPLAAAPYDTRINGAGKGDPKYGFAARPFRDPMGNVIAEDGILPGSYPWVDKEGRNVIFSTVNPRLFDGAHTAARYPLAHTSKNEPFGNVGGSQRGFSIVGNWTNGKVVMLDDMLNNDDGGVFPDDEYEFGLYKSGANTVAVRVNGDGKLDTGELHVPRAIANNHHIDSTENMTAMHAKSAGVTPRDVVWTISRGLNSDEVAFDDYVDPHVVLFAEMNAAWETIPGDAGTGRYHDGFGQKGALFTHDPAAIRLQNAATSPIFTIASSGRIDGAGRVEPVASGGIQGRGLWLESASDAHWDFDGAVTKTVGPAGFYAGVFVDSRDDMKGEKHLFSLRPTQGTTTEVTITDGSIVHVAHGGDAVSFDVSCSAQTWDHAWHHVGVLFEDDGHVTLFLDGNPLGYAKLASPLALEPGSFVVGGTATVSGAPGIRGWYDEARIVVNGAGDQLAGPASVELLCNYARGTMVAASSGSNEYALAKATPSIAARATRVGSAKSPSGDYLYCATDYDGYTLANRGYSLGVNYTPAHTTSMRAKILLEGTQPLAYDQPRPDSTNRSFCRSCHTSIDQDASRTSTLTLAALKANGTRADLDSRTQPSQPSVFPGDDAARVWGTIPAGWIATASGRSLPSKRETGGVPILDFVFVK